MKQTRQWGGGRIVVVVVEIEISMQMRGFTCNRSHAGPKIEA